jgi:tetratricopeptide (TPR) repeat protein
VDLELAIILAVGLVVVAGLVFALIRQRASKELPATSRRGPKPLSRTTPPRDRAAESAPKNAAPARKLSDHEVLAAEGKMEEAGRMAMRAQEWKAALAYYLKAGQPANAAHCARHAELFDRAAELYEQAGDLEAAAECHERLGHTERARELRRGALQRRQSDPKASAHAAPQPTGDAPVPSDLASQIETAQQAGDRQRAATLLEQTGDNERAANEWVEVARRSKDPVSYVSRIERLSPTVCHRFLELETRARPLSKATAELHYQLALSFGRLDDSAAACQILKKLVAAVGDYKAASVLLRDPAQLARSRTLPSVRATSDRPMELLTDARVLQARSGPSIDELTAMLNGKSCDLGNIEVFYRLGLAYLADSRFEEASTAFAQVSEVSPGYRDAERRLEHIRTKLEGEG